MLDALKVSADDIIVKKVPIEISSTWVDTFNSIYQFLYKVVQGHLVSLEQGPLRCHALSGN